MGLGKREVSDEDAVRVGLEELGDGRVGALRCGLCDCRHGCERSVAVDES